MKTKPWSLKTLKERLSYYKKLLEQAESIKEQQKLDEIIKSYEEHIHDLTTFYKPLPYPQIKRLDKAYQEELNEIIPIILKANDFLVNNHILLPDELFSINTSKENILKTTKSFYSIINGIYKEKYDEYYNTNAIYINFTSNIDKNICGNIIRPRGVAECFINIGLFNNPYDIATSIHEHSHAIAASINEEHIDNSLLNEVESIFFELIYLDMLDKNQYRPEQIKNTKEVTIGMYNKNMHSIDAKLMYPNKKLSYIKGIIEEKYNIDPSLSEGILLSPLCGYINYAFSYLIAIELYYIYKKCEYKALDKLEEIIRIEFEEEDLVLKYLQDIGINPGNNFKQFYKDYLNIKGTTRKK